MNDFYIYIYLDPRKSGKYKYGEKYEFNYEPFYVGKGIGKRINDKKNNHCENKINKIKRLGFEPIRRRIKENIKENESFELEKELIELIGRKELKEGPLTNKTDGGEGTSGYKPTEEILKKRRKNFSEIKKEFEKRNYKLLIKEEEYENAHQKLEYICPFGHKDSMCWDKFRINRNCPYCKKIILNKKFKKNFSEVKKEFEKRGYELLIGENDYKNCYTKLEYKCFKGHIGKMSWSNFQQGKDCPYCGTEEQAKKRRKNFQDIIREFEKRNYTLLTEENEYKNNEIKLEYECPEGHRYLISWGSFQQGQGCPICGTEEQAKKQRKKFQDIIREFENRDYQLLTEEKDYKNAHQKLEYIHNKCGKKHSISWSNFQQGHGCSCIKRKK